MIDSKDHWNWNYQILNAVVNSEEKKRGAENNIQVITIMDNLIMGTHCRNSFFQDGFGPDEAPGHRGRGATW